MTGAFAPGVTVDLGDMPADAVAFGGIDAFGETAAFGDSFAWGEGVAVAAIAVFGLGLGVAFPCAGNARAPGREKQAIDRKNRNTREGQ